MVDRHLEKELADQKLFIDELNQIRLVNPALLESSSKLAEEGKTFFGQFEQFQRTVADVRVAMEKIGRITDRERLRLLALQSQLEQRQGVDDAGGMDEEAQQVQLQIAERHKELERLKVELASLKAVEAQQQEYLAMCKKL